MADVYLATDTNTGREVALKMVEQKPDRDSQEVCEAERRGAILQQQFCGVDSHVPAVHGCGSRDGYFFIDMEYVEGEDLAERIARGPMAPEEASAIALELCTFLAKAHQFETTVDDAPVRGIIHADIKPKNIRINSTGQVKVLDFGIAKGLALSRKLTRNDFGSLAYLSPERLETGEVDVNVDYWSVGILLYEMLSGQPPFGAETNSRLEALIRRREPPPPLPSDCPPGLARIVMKMLAGDPMRRYRSADEVNADLEAFRANEQSVADREWLEAEQSDATRRTIPANRENAPADETRRTIGVTDVDATAPDVLSRSENADTPTTAPGPDDAEATRRTLPPPVPVNLVTAGDVTLAGAPAPTAVATATVPILSPFARRMVTIRRWTAVAAVLVAIVLVGNELLVWSDAKKLRVDVATRDSSATQDLWDRYQAIAPRSVLGLGLVGARGALKEKLNSQAERVVSDYRQDEPTVHEQQWRDAVGWLTNSLRLDPADRRTAARLHYCQGQVNRITGEFRRRRKLATAAQPLHDAVTEFEEAARLDPQWPDPFLGLARVYVYGIEDVDKSIAAVEDAKRRGYKPGNRELVQLADGYRSRGDRMFREAAGVRGLDQERQCLEKAAADYRQAINIYGQAIGFGEASSTMKQVQARLSDVQKQIDSLQEG